MVILLSLFLILFSFHTIDLSTADIGRHITNGKIFLHSAQYGISKSDLLYTNLFSYTYPTFPFINHHWASGVAIYLIFQMFGFGGLSLLYFLFILGAFIFTIKTVGEDVDISTIFLTAIFLAPLIAGRIEVRPEGLSYLFIAVFLYILYKYSKDRVSPKMLWLLPVLELVWANSHIYFIFGIFLIGVFFGEALLLGQIEKVKKLGMVLGASIVATFITPYGIQGLLYPFTIFQNYGYRIVENQSIYFLEHLSFTNPEFLWYKITLGLLVISSIIILWKERRSFSIALSILSLTFAILGYSGIRYIPLFALFSLPLLAYNFTIIRKTFHRPMEGDLKIILYGLISFVIISATLFQFSSKLPWNRDFGLGIKSDQLFPARFIENNNIHGPFFNNYDIGGYMILSLFPKEKVFVDNRPEAYPKEFFDNVYIPMQENDIVWQEELAKEKFNAIFFYRLDYTPWAQKFLVTRISDPAWAPVFVDSQTIIFLRREEENKNIIEKYELPKSMFNVK